MISWLLVMADEEHARYLMEQIIAGCSGYNLPVTYSDQEGSQVDMFLNMSGDGNEEPEPKPEQNLAMTEGSGEVYIISIILPHL